MPGYQYPKDDPHWIQATRVQLVFEGFVKVWIGDKCYGIQPIGWSNPFMDKTKSDCLVKDQESGWLKIWWNDADVEPS